MPHVSLSSTLISSFFAPQSCHRPPFQFWDNLPTQQPHVLCIYASWLIPSLSSNNHHSFSHLFNITCTTTPPFCSPNSLFHLHLMFCTSWQPHVSIRRTPFLLNFLLNFHPLQQLLLTYFNFIVFSSHSP